MLRTLTKSFLVFVTVMFCCFTSSQESKRVKLVKQDKSELKRIAFIQKSKDGENFLWIRLTSYQYRFAKSYVRLHKGKSARTIVRNLQYLAIKESLREYFTESTLFPERFILQVSVKSITTIKDSKYYYITRHLEVFLQKIQTLESTKSNIYEEQDIYDDEEEEDDYGENDEDSDNDKENNHKKKA